MKKRSLAAAAFCLFCLAIFAQPTKRYLDLLDKKREPARHWMQVQMVVGTHWEYQNDGKTRLWQTWEKTDDTTMVGCAFTVLERDTTWLETMHLLKKGPEIRFIPDVFAARPAVFVLSRKKESEFIFENPDGVFPQEMTLEQVGRKEFSMIFRGWLFGKKVESRSVFHKSKE